MLFIDTSTHCQWVNTFKLYDMISKINFKVYWLIDNMNHDVKVYKLSTDTAL